MPGPRRNLRLFQSRRHRVPPLGNLSLKKHGSTHFRCRNWENPYWTLIGLSGSSRRHRSADTGAAALGPASSRGWLEAELDQLLGVALPVLGHLYMEIQVDAGAEQRFNAFPCVRPDFTEPATPLANDDGLL